MLYFFSRTTLIRNFHRADGTSGKTFASGTGGMFTICNALLCHLI